MTRWFGGRGIGLRFVLPWLLMVRHTQVGTTRSLETFGEWPSSIIGSNFALPDPMLEQAVQGDGATWVQTHYPFWYGYPLCDRATTLGWGASVSTSLWEGGSLSVPGTSLRWGAPYGGVHSHCYSERFGRAVCFSGHCVTRRVVFSSSSIESVDFCLASTEGQELFWLCPFLLWRDVGTTFQGLGWIEVVYLCKNLM